MAEMAQIIFDSYILLNLIYYYEMSADLLMLNGLRGFMGDIIVFSFIVYTVVADKSSGIVLRT